MTNSGKTIFNAPVWLLRIGFVIVIAVGFASVRQSTPLVWDDSPHVAAILLENGGKPYAYQESLFQAVSDSFSRVRASGYRPLSQFISNIGVPYLALGGSIFVWSLFVGALIGACMLAMHGVAARFLGSGRFAALAVFLFAFSSPFVAATWVIAVGLQVIVPLFICIGLLAYWRLENSGFRSQLWYFVLGLIFLLGPWFREFTGLTAVLVGMMDLIARRKPTAVTALCAAGLAHAVFPGLLLHLFVPGAPVISIFQLGALGAQVVAGTSPADAGSLTWFVHSLRWEVVPHFLVLLPSTVFPVMLAALLVKARDCLLAGRCAPADSRAIGLGVLLFWLSASLLPFLKVFTEEVHLAYALIPFCMLVALSFQYVLSRTPGKGRYGPLCRRVTLTLLCLSIGDQAFNYVNSIAIVRGINSGMQTVARKIKTSIPAGSIVVGNALHLEDIRLFSGGHFTGYWTVSSGVSANRVFLTRESLAEFMTQTQKEVYFLDISQDFLPQKRDYHSHQFVRNKGFEMKRLWTMDAVKVTYPFLDPAKNFIPRLYTTVLFAPDLENDFYRGLASGGAPFIREVNASYTLYRVPSRNPRIITATASGDVEDPIYGPQYAFGHGRFWEVAGKQPARLEISLNAPLTMSDLELASGADEPARMPNAIEVLWSDDKNNWQRLSRVETGSWGKNEHRTFSLASAVGPKQYYRIEFFTPKSPAILRVYGIKLKFNDGDIERIDFTSTPGP